MTFREYGYTILKTPASSAWSGVFFVSIVRLKNACAKWT